MTELATRKSTAISLPPNTHPTSTGLVMAGVSRKDHEHIGRFLASVDSASQWWQGDWFNAIDPAYGEHEAVCRKAGLNYGTVRNYARVCAAIESARRRADLSFGHHTEVAVLTLEAEEQDELLDKAAAQGWNRDRLRASVQARLQLSDGPVDDNLLGDDAGEIVPAPGISDPPDDDDAVPAVTDNGMAAVLEEAKAFVPLQSLLGTLKTKLNDLAKTKAGAMLAEEMDSIERHRMDIFRLVKFSRPFGECLYCKGSGEKAGRVCRACKGRRWMNELAFKVKQPTKETQT